MDGAEEETLPVLGAAYRMKCTKYAIFIFSPNNLSAAEF